MDDDDLLFIDGGPEDMVMDVGSPGMMHRQVPMHQQAPHGAPRPAVEPVNDMDFVDTEGQPHVSGPREHHAMRARTPNVDVYAQHAPTGHPMHRPPMRPAPMPFHTQAIGQGPPRSMGQEQGGGGNGMLGLSLLGLGLGVAVGAKLKGLPGAAAGGLFAGSAINLLRASTSYVKGTPEADKEGRVAATYALVGAGAGGLLTYRYILNRPADGSFKPNPQTQSDDDLEDCDIRPVGP